MQTQNASTSLVPSTSVVGTSDPVIAAVAGKFYSYRADFSSDRPLAYFMDCKANKSRSLADVDQIDREVPLELVFLFSNTVRACSPNAPASIRLLGDLVEVNETRIARANITEDAFNALRQNKDGQALAIACRAATVHSDNIVTLEQGMILAVTTEVGKYGLLRITELTASSVKIDACHILL